MDHFFLGRSRADGDEYGRGNECGEPSAYSHDKISL